jgi:four helix bundle protein
MTDEIENKKAIVDHRELKVYQLAFDSAMAIFHLTADFPTEERYSLSDQLRRSSRSICANIAEAWRKRRYEAAFLGKLNDAEAEAGETQSWIEFSVSCGYINEEDGQDLNNAYDYVLGGLVEIIRNPTPWLLRRSLRSGKASSVTNELASEGA